MFISKVVYYSRNEIYLNVFEMPLNNRNAFLFGSSPSGLALLAKIKHCEAIVKEKKLANFHLKVVTSRFPDMALDILTFIEQNKLPMSLLDTNALLSYLSFIKQGYSQEDVPFLLMSQALPFVYQAADSIEKQQAILVLLKNGYDDKDIINKLLLNPKKIESILFLEGISQASLIASVLNDDNEDVILAIKRLLGANIPKTLASQLKARLHEVLASKDLVCLLKSSHNNRKQFIELKLYLLGIKNKKKVNQYINNKKKVKTLYQKIAKPVIPIKSILEIVKKSLSEKSGKISKGDGKKAKKKSKKIKLKTKSRNAKCSKKIAKALKAKHAKHHAHHAHHDNHQAHHHHEHHRAHHKHHAEHKHVHHHHSHSFHHSHHHAHHEHHGHHPHHAHHHEHHHEHKHDDKSHENHSAHHGHDETHASHNAHLEHKEHASSHHDSHAHFSFFKMAEEHYHKYMHDAMHNFMHEHGH